MSWADTGLRVAFLTLGCKLNQFESDALASEFVGAGHTICQDTAMADVCIINACAVTDNADRKSQAELKRCLKLADGPRLIVLSGCLAPNALPPENERVLIVAPDQKSHILSLVEARLQGLAAAKLPPDNFSFAVASAGFHTRGSIKIQDGCDSFCSYCIIPQTRGSSVSRPVSAILEEVRQLSAYGFRELILTGVNIGRYWSEDIDFTSLVREILELKLPAGQDFRLRIGSLEPFDLSRKFIVLFRNPRLCRNLHLCLQSGSDAILQQMKRNYTTRDFSRIVHDLRKLDPNFTISTDLITGFPGENSSDFQASLDLLIQLEISHVHVFPYSVRSGTVAATMAGQVPDIIKRRRAIQARSVNYAQGQAWLQRFVGRSVICLVEQVVCSRDDTGTTTVRLSGHSHHGIALRIDLSPNAARVELAKLPDRAIIRPFTPAMSQAELGFLADFWNRELTVAAMKVEYHSQLNPEPVLVCVPLDNPPLG